MDLDQGALDAFLCNMSTYTAKQGDTFEAIARRLYGTEKETGRIRKANPTVSETMTAGTLVFIPEPPAKTKINAAGDDVTVLIDGVEFKNFIDINLNLSFTSFDSCSIVAPFEPENTAFRNVFKPFSYQDVAIYIGGELIFSGTQIGIQPEVTPASKTVTLTAYARCAVTNDSCVPISAYPISLRGLDLKKIAEILTDPFPFSAVTNVNTGAKFDNASIKHTDKVATFLTVLAKQRDLVITNNNNGDLLITKSIDGEPVAQLKGDQPPVIRVAPSFNEQEYFSDYTAILPVIVRQTPTQYTAKNKKLTSIMRIDNFIASDAKNGDEKTVAESRRSRGMANAISYFVELATIRDPQGELYRPNTNINLQALDAMIYNDTKFLIRGVSMNLSSRIKTCALDLVLPEAYNGKEVGVYPWEN